MEPTVFGVPVSLAFLYFIIYSFLGWGMETIYCSIPAGRFVRRGFLYGPICPIYGVGVLMMICWFAPLMGNPVLFYLTATVCMSAWEYFVGWLLETTTHIKYWDYSDKPFNLQGRICLQICLAWGVLSFLVLYFIQPRVAALVAQVPSLLRYVLCGFFLGLLTSDAAATVYQLAKTAQLLEKVQQAGDELRLQVHLGREELEGRLSEAREAFAGRIEDLLPEDLDEAGRALKARYDELVSRTEYLSRRLRSRYTNMRSTRASDALESVKRRGEGIRRRLEQAREELQNRK